MNAPADSPERIAQILREILALSGNEEDSEASQVEHESERQLKLRGPDSPGETAHPDDPTVNG